MKPFPLYRGIDTFEPTRMSILCPAEKVLSNTFPGGTFLVWYAQKQAPFRFMKELYNFINIITVADA